MSAQIQYRICAVDHLAQVFINSVTDSEPALPQSPDNGGRPPSQSRGRVEEGAPDSAPNLRKAVLREPLTDGLSWPRCEFFLTLAGFRCYKIVNPKVCICGYRVLELRQAVAPGLEEGPGRKMRDFREVPNLLALTAFEALRCYSLWIWRKR
jgi:hypothetical protein